MKKHHKKAFEKIQKEKRDRIRKAAITEFADKGFIAANINVIAKNAGVSIGSMYNYFESKEELLLSVIDYGYTILEEIIFRVIAEDGDIFTKIENLLRAAQQYSRKYPELNQIYLDISSEGLSHLSKRLSRKIESISAQFYRSLIVQAKTEGLVDSGLDAEVTAFCLDNLILLLQYSYTSDYFKERMKIFAGEDVLKDDERMISGMMRFIRGGLTPGKKVVLSEADSTENRMQP